MKKFIAVIAFLMVSNTWMSHAQNVAVGLRGGINLATIANENLEPDHMVVGINVAIPVEIQVADFLAIQPELHFIQKGAGFEADGADITYNYFFNYLEVPVLVKGMVGNDLIKGYAIAGPSVGFALSQYQVTKTDDDRESESIDFVDSGDIQNNRFDIGVALGAGVEIPVGIGAFVLDARYNLDLNDQVKFEGDAPDNWEKNFNRGIGITVGYSILLNK